MRGHDGVCVVALRWILALQGAIDHCTQHGQLEPRKKNLHGRKQSPPKTGWPCCFSTTNDDDDNDKSSSIDNAVFLLDIIREGRGDKIRYPVV